MPRRAQKRSKSNDYGTYSYNHDNNFCHSHFFIKIAKKSLRAVNQFNVNDYIKEGSTLLGNEGIVTGTINEKLRWTAQRGEVISLRVENINQLIPVLIPPSFKDTNIAIGDRFTFRIEVGAAEVLTAKEIIRR